jgi:hypothetical protein
MGAIQEGISGAEAFVSYGNLYLAGGYSDSMQAPVNWVRTYDSFLNSVETIGNMARKRKNFVSAVNDKSFYFFGGEDGLSVIGPGTLESFQSVFLTSSIYDSSIIFNRNNGAGLFLNGHLFMIGGLPAGASLSSANPYLYEYNPLTRTVVYKQDSAFSATAAREGQICVAVGSRIYLFGGVNNTVLNDIYRFNAVDHSYKKMSINMQIPRANGQAVYDSVHHYLYVFGGFNENTGALSSGEVYYALDTTFMFVRSMPAMHFARKDFMAVIYEGAIWAFGGYDEAAHTIRDVESYSINVVSGITRDPLGPEKYCTVQQNYPNPFNPSTRISYSLAGNGHVSIRIFDVLGREVRSLLEEMQPSGVHSVLFDAAALPSGIYYYQVTVKPLSPHEGNFYRETKKCCSSDEDAIYIAAAGVVLLSGTRAAKNFNSGYTCTI